MIAIYNDKNFVTVRIQVIEPTADVIDALNAYGLDISDHSYTYQSREHLQAVDFIDDEETMAKYEAKVLRDALRNLAHYFVDKQMAEFYLPTSRQNDTEDGTPEDEGDTDADS